MQSMSVENMLYVFEPPYFQKLMQNATVLLCLLLQEPGYVVNGQVASIPKLGMWLPYVEIMRSRLAYGAGNPVGCTGPQAVTQAFKVSVL
jgi:hypothetical protein